MWPKCLQNVSLTLEIRRRTCILRKKCIIITASLQMGTSVVGMCVNYKVMAAVYKTAPYKAICDSLTVANR